MGSGPGEGCISAHLAGGSPTCCSAPPQVPSSIRQWRPAPPPGHTSLPPHSPSVLRAAVPLAAPSVAAGAAAAAGATLLPHLLYCATNTHSHSLTHSASLAASPAPASPGRPRRPHRPPWYPPRPGGATPTSSPHQVTTSYQVSFPNHYIKDLTWGQSFTLGQFLTLSP